MLLQDKFFQVLSVEKADANNATFRCRLLADCDCYRGHFPGKPVSPGVCNMEMIKECAMLLSERALTIAAIKQCRLTAVAAPHVCPEVNVSLALTPKEGGYTLIASIADARQGYMEFKGELVIRA